MMTLSLLMRHQKLGKFKYTGGFPLSSFRAIGLERLVQDCTYKSITVLYTYVFPIPEYTYLLFDLIHMQSEHIMITLIPLSWENPGLDSATYCVVANLCTTVRIQLNAESPRARTQARLLDGPFSHLLRHAGSQ